MYFILKPRDMFLFVAYTGNVPVCQAVRRLVERNGIAEEDALKRLSSQMSNEQRVSRANVVLCTLWHPDITQKQVLQHTNCVMMMLCKTLFSVFHQWLKIQNTPMSSCEFMRHLWCAFVLMELQHLTTIQLIFWNYSNWYINGWTRSCRYWDVPKTWAYCNLSLYCQGATPN